MSSTVVEERGPPIATARRWAQTAPSARTLFALTALFVAARMALALATALHRGPWLDEFWSLWMEQPNLGLVDAATHRWFHDVYPPLFYFINWALQPLIGPSVEAHRMVNLIPVISMLGVGWWLSRRDTALGPVAVVLIALVMSGFDFLAFDEHRSYMFIQCTTVALLLLLYAIDRQATDLTASRDRSLAVVTAVTILVALNLHAISSSICGVLVGVVALEQGRRRRWRWGALLLGSAFIGALLLALTVAAERGYIATVAPLTFIHTTTIGCLRILLDAITGGFARNLVVLACLAWIGIVFLRRRSATVAALPDRGAWRFASLLLIAMSVSAVLLLLLNMVQSTVIPRYVMPIGIMTATAAAVVCARLIASRTWILALFLLNAILIPIPRSILGEWGAKNWDEGGGLAAREVRACPQTLVYGVDRYAMIWGPESPDGREIKEFGLREDAKRFGFTVHPIRYYPGVTHVASPAPCPTVLWSEHLFGDYKVARLVTSTGLPIAPSRTGLIKELPTNSGVVIVIPHAAMLRPGEAAAR